jgi:hypothetical protein
MKHLKPLSALILIASALLLSAANSIGVSPSPLPPKSEKHEGLPEQETAPSDGGKTETPLRLAPIDPTPTGVIGGSTSDQQQQEPKRERPLPSLTDWIIACVTSLYAVIAFYTLRTIKRQADLSERAMTSLERPWIDVKLISLNGGPTGNEPTITVVRLKLINYGRSPALITRSWLDFTRVIVSSLSEEPDYPATEGGPFVNVAPNRATPTIQVGIQLTGEEALAIAAQPRERTLMLYGYVDYRDVFGKEHQTRYCYFYFPPATARIPAFPIPGSLVMGGPPNYNRQT